MLHQWAALNSQPGPQNQQKETSEQLEQRLRAQYEDALSFHREDPPRAAELLTQLSSELSLPRKRPRTVQPLWKRRLRYAVNRNLAAAQDTLERPLQAAASYATALEDDPSDFLVWVKAARSSAQSGSLHKARRAYEIAMTMHPQHFLAVAPYAAVIRAIGDADDDVDHLDFSNHNHSTTALVKSRCDYMKREKDCVEPSPAAERITINELSWACLVDSLRQCLQRRLHTESATNVYTVGHPVTFELPTESAGSPPASSDDVQVVIEALTTSCDVDDVQVISDSPNRQPIQSGDAQVLQRSPDVSAELDESNAVHNDEKTANAVDLTEAQGNDNLKEYPAHDTIMKSGEVSPESKNTEHRKLNFQASNVAEDAQLQKATWNSARGETITGASSAEHRLNAENEDTKEKVRSEFSKSGIADQNKPEVRRSARARAAFESAAEIERRKTRTVTGMIDVETVDTKLIQTLLHLCTEEHEVSTDPSSSSNVVTLNPVSYERKFASPQLEKDTPQRISAWTEVVDEQKEADEVRACISHFGDINSGPADLLLRLLRVLSDIRVVQYSSTLALVWSTLRERLQLHMPGSAETSALIAESMISSGRKAAKVKAQRFLEAERLLSNIRLPPSLGDDTCFLKVRLSWCWALLCECKGEMQSSFTSTEHTLTLLQRLKIAPEEHIPESVGPDLSGYTNAAAQKIVKNRLARLKGARDLEKAEEELRRAGRGDTEAARTTIGILGASVRAAVRSLRLDQWDDDDLKTKFEDVGELELWDARLDAEVELEPRMRVFGDACSKAMDMVGELVCFSIRLRMAVRYYAATLRNEAGKELAQAKSKDSSETRLADLLVQIRKYVSLVKKIAGPASSSLWNCEAGITGWSMKSAVSIASLTLVSLTKLIITKIPILRLSAGTELGASQKNRRLGLTRCMLAFARCIYVMQKCGKHGRPTLRGVQQEEVKDSSFAIKMLFTTSFCLRALVARGCCREEGTSGALIKLYVKFLTLRLQDIASIRETWLHSDKSGAIEVNKTKYGSTASDAKKEARGVGGAEDQREINAVVAKSEDETPISSVDVTYSWNNIQVLRHELAQCFQCLYRIPDIEPEMSGSEQVYSVRWLEEGCRISKEIGLSFITGDSISASPTIDLDACCSVFFFYRKRIFELFCQQRRDGGRGKRLREVLSRLTEALPEDPPKSVPMLPFQALDTIVSEVVDSSDDISKNAAENVSRLEDEWIREAQSKEDGNSSSMQLANNVRFSILYFEVFSLHAMSMFSAHNTEYKRHKSAERRKHPKEAVDRVLAVSSESLVALRCRPWSVGSWILLGRIFVEISDLALDERELNLSTFGISRSENLQSLGEGDYIATIFGRAEACFGFAESLLRQSWACKPWNQALGVLSSSVLGCAYDGNDEAWNGIGDDGDLFGLFGLTNDTSSRPRLKHEDHPGENAETANSRRLAAIQSGSAALSILRLREARYFHVHWTLSSLEPKLSTHPQNRFPDAVVHLSHLALRQLRAAQQSYGMDSTNFPMKADSMNQYQSSGPNVPQQQQDMPSSPVWRQEYLGNEKQRWLYSLLEAKLLRKLGKPSSEYLEIFQRSLDQNKRMRQLFKQPFDIEPFYQLHAARMKILRNVDDNASAIKVLNLLERYSFRPDSPPQVEDFPEKDTEDWIAERKTVIAEDILSAMHFCSSRKSEVPYSEFYFKSSFCKAVLLAEVLKDVSSALEELAKCFRLDAAVKALDQGHDATHRGYFYKIWNYRFTDTGVEPALETERKLVRWRSKLLGFYGQLLKQTGDWRSLAAIIFRLKKRNAEDLPVDGALLDDLVEAYAITSRGALLTSMEKSIVKDASAFESSYHRAWFIFEESLRLSQGVRRVRVGLSRGETNETGGERLVRSGRPRCLVPMHTVLRLEHLRWRSALDGTPINLNEVRELPTQGRLRQVPRDIRMLYGSTLQVSIEKWKLDEKMTKLVSRRIAELAASYD